MRIGLNEGSLLRRTLLHVATFVIGSLMIVGVSSVTLVAIAKGFTKPAEAAVSDPASARSDAKDAHDDKDKDKDDKTPTFVPGSRPGRSSPKFGARGMRPEPHNNE